MVNIHVSFKGLHYIFTSDNAPTNFPSFRIHSIHKRAEHRLVSTFRGELIGLGILWLFWLVGAAVASVRYTVRNVRM